MCRLAKDTRFCCGGFNSEVDTSNLMKNTGCPCADSMWRNMEPGESIWDLQASGTELDLTAWWRWQSSKGQHRAAFADLKRGGGIPHGWLHCCLTTSPASSFKKPSTWSRSSRLLGRPVTLAIQGESSYISWSVLIYVRWQKESEETKVIAGENGVSETCLMS